jgi:hypothetical protein
VHEIRSAVSLTRLMGPGLFKKMGPGDRHEDQVTICHKSMLLARPKVSL